MSIDTAISRIQQIVVMQQQLLDPGAAATAANATPATSPAGATTTGGAGASFASALASAQGAAGGVSLTAAPTASALSAPVAVQTMLQKAQSLVGRPYVWGGGHSTSDWMNAAGYDCSGFVSAVLGSAGVISSPQTTQTLPSQPGLAAGPGQYVTIYDRDTSADPGQDHVIIDINGTWFESGGNSADNPSGGVAQINPPSQAYLATFNQQLHPVGM
jgi:cell wall-associated NlpC family hydrolase